MGSSFRPIFLRDATGLTKHISALDALSMSLSGMGLLFVYNVVAFVPAFYSRANPLIFPLVGLLFTVPFAAMFILMSIAMPRTGGDYVWVSRIIHPSVGFITNFAITAITLSFVGTSTSEAVQWAAGEMFYDFGKMYGNQNFLRIAAYLQEQTPVFLFSVVLILLAAAIVVAKVDLAQKIVRYWTFLALAIGAIFVGTILSAGNSTFISNFNALSGANYNEVILAGQKAGAYSGVPALLSLPSLYAGVFGLLGFINFNFPVYFAGEVKEVRKSQVLAIFGALLIYAGFKTIMVAAEYFGEGPAFVNALATLWITGSREFPYLTTPLASGMSMFWTQNPVLVAVFNLSFAANIEVMNIAILFALTRNLFAWSFDRITLSAFADVNAKTRTPINATGVMVVGALIYTYVVVFRFGILATLFSYGVAGMFLAFMIVSISAVLFPLTRRNIFTQSHATSKRKLAGLPVISLLGIMNVALSSIVIRAIMGRSVGRPFASVLVEGIIPTFIIGILLYGMAYGIRKRQGIDLGLLARGLPPE
jgi:amino acid transporter